MTDRIPLKRALISVSDKTGLLDFARALEARGVEILSTGGTAKALREAGLIVKDVAEVTGFPEMMDGRVKTLHPVVHGGLLALRDNDEHMAAAESHGIGMIDLLVVNLYPFEETVARGAGYDDCIENIDIGGPAMIRAASKNHAFVTVVVDVEDYAAVLAELDANDDTTTYAFRQRQAQIAYARTAAYDAAVSAWMAGAIGNETPRRRAFAGTLAQSLRYGENPHQSAAFYKDGSDRAGVATAKQWQGKELSYNNINDTDAAFELVAEFDPAEGPAVAIIKHANPCGVARGKTALEAYRRAYDCDRTSAFGGIVALNTELDGDTARAIAEIFTEVVIAPAASDEAKEIFAAKKNPRLLIMDEPTSVLTPQEAEILFATLRQLAAQGTAILYISHKLDEIRTHCDRATILRHGKVVGTVDPRAHSARALAAMMVGAEMRVIDRSGRKPGAEVLRVSGLSAGALKGVGLTLRGGEILGIGGVAGNGQEDLLAALSGEAPTPPGTVALDGADLSAQGPEARRKAGLLSAPEDRLGHAAVPEFSLTENTLLTAGMRQGIVRHGLVDHAGARRFAERVIAAFDVRTPGPRTAAGALSGGNLQKFVIGREVLGQPRVLVVNQPTWGVDAGAAAAIRQALLDLAAQGAGIIVISQDLDELLELSDRFCALNEGRLSAPRPTEGLTIEEIGLMLGGAHGMEVAHVPA